MELEFISNSSFFLFFSILVLCVSFAFSLFASLILGTKKTVYLAIFITILYYVLSLGSKLTSVAPQTEHLYLAYVTVLTIAISIGVILGIQTRKFVTKYAKTLEKKSSRSRMVKLVIILITLAALLYDIFYLSTAPNKSTSRQNILTQQLE